MKRVRISADSPVVSDRGLATCADIRSGDTLLGLDSHGQLSWARVDVGRSSIEDLGYYLITRSGEATLHPSTHVFTSRGSIATSRLFDPLSERVRGVKIEHSQLSKDVNLFGTDDPHEASEDQESAYLLGAGSCGFQGAKGNFAIRVPHECPNRRRIADAATELSDREDQVWVEEGTKWDWVIVADPRLRQQLGEFAARFRESPIHAWSAGGAWMRKFVQGVEDAGMSPDGPVHLTTCDESRARDLVIHQACWLGRTYEIDPRPAYRPVEVRVRFDVRPQPFAPVRCVSIRPRTCFLELGWEDDYWSLINGLMIVS